MQAREVVARLAAALDRDDFVTARALLADACVYRRGEETLHGADAAIASYAESAAWVKRQFEEVRYASEVDPAGDSGAASAAAPVAVLFTDYLLHAATGWHRHRCRQEFTVGASGTVERIEHHDLPGEREALAAFLARCGIER